MKSLTNSRFSWPALLTESTTGIAFGGDYNPDQWPEDVWTQDIELMKRAGVNVVALGIFSWDRIQPTEDTWDFAWLDRIIGQLGEAGIAVDLATSTASAPMWLYKRYPQVLPVDKYGHTVHAGSRQSWRPTSKVFREFALEMCRQLALRYGNNPTVTSWHVGNEYGWNNRHDYSEDAARAFITWCENKYGTIDALNEAWGTSFWSQEVRSFDEVQLPYHMGADSMVNPSQQLDFERFGNDMLLDFYRAERDAIQSICPDKPCTTNFMISTDQCSMDYQQWAAEVDFVSNDHYFHEGESHLDELTCSDALVAALAQGKPWYVMEHSTSAVQWKPLNARKRNGELLRDSLAHVAIGADAINFFQWRQSRFGAEAFHSAMVPHAGEDSKLFRGVCELGESLKTLSDAGLQGSTLKPSDTAILFSAASEWATRCETLPSKKLSHWHDVLAWYRGFEDAGARADVVPLANDWSDYSTVILPTVLVLSDSDTERLATFAKNGGRVIIGYATGLIDENFHIGLGGYPGAGNGLLRDMLGMCGEEFNILGEELGDENQAITLSNGAQSVLWQNDVTVRGDVDVLATYTGAAAQDWELSNTPAFTRARYGKGYAYFVGCDLDRADIAKYISEVLQSENTSAANLLHTVRESETAVFDFYFARAETDLVLACLPQDAQVLIISSAQKSSNTENSYALGRNGILITKRRR
ncbi:beta-galactosidase [Alloscardovia omnicolens]|uniref:beta-galactosidase n=1 Tax=Alloscardovia omnicolens TaxID=419015 RepID=UPI0006695077|nr:beta-galactosidase [Alloscardovia omnicolens]